MPQFDIENRKNRKYLYDHLYVSNEDINNLKNKSEIVGGMVECASLITNNAVMMGEYVATPVKLGIWAVKGIGKIFKKK